MTGEDVKAAAAAAKTRPAKGRKGGGKGASGGRGGKGASGGRGGKGASGGRGGKGGGGAGPAPAQRERFRMGKSGVEYLWIGDDKHGGARSEKWIGFSSPLEVRADTRSDESAEWGRLLAVKDSAGIEHLWAMPMEALAGSGEEYRRVLFGLGLILAPGRVAREKLHEYIATARPKARARCVGRIGWHGRRFVLPDETLGPDADGDQVILQTGAPLDHAYAVAGDLAQWRDLAGLAAGNHLLLFAVSLAFAGPLLHILELESGGLHLRGPSSSGKSTALALAGSVWGGGGLRGYVRQWRATDNALEGVAALHSDTFLALDEIGQVEPKAAGAAAYMLANGSGKARAGRDGSARRPAQWRCLFLSSGEIGLADKVAEAGQRMTAGMGVRVIDVRADGGAGLGLFAELHGEPGADALAQRIRRGAAEVYGTAGRAFVTRVADDPERVRVEAGKMMAAFVREAVQPGSDGQVRRVADRFALVAVAGELARAFGIVPWPEGAAMEAARRCFAGWIEERGGTGAAEIADAVNRLRSFLEAHGSARFEPWKRDPRRAVVINRAGFVKRGEEDPETGDPMGPPVFHIFPGTWTKEIMAGLDLCSVNAALVASGVIITDKDGKPQTSHSPSAHVGKTGKSGTTLRLYQINPDFLGGGP